VLVVVPVVVMTAHAQQYGAEGRAPRIPERARMQQRIDVHHHMLPKEWIAAASPHKAGGHWAPHVLQWSPQGSIDNMDRYGISTAILSIGLPGVWWGDVDAARKLSRWLNEYAASLVRDYPGRFGFFATLPMPDVEGSIAEIGYALDVLGADGIGMLTSYDNTWPGDPRFDAVFAELSRRNAVTYFHPTVPGCCQGITPDIPVATIEYTFDTTRAITNLLFTGSFARHTGVRWIFSHGGGTIPFLAGRIDHIAGSSEKIAARLPEGVEPALRRLNFELATATHAPSLAATRALMPVERLLMGTDYPYVETAPILEGLAACPLDPRERRLIEAENALALFPRLRTPGRPSAITGS
jgi:predicted TIM-barrel fold metal-dependent hydrolase